MNLPTDAQIVPGKKLVAITADDSEFTGGACRGIFIMTAGDFTIQCEDDAAAQAITLAVGVYPLCVKKCTSGTGLWAIY